MIPRSINHQSTNMVDFVLKFLRKLTKIFCYRPKWCVMTWNGFSSSSVYICAIFSFWVMVDFVFYLRSAFRTMTNSEKLMLGGLRLLNSPYLWGASPPTPFIGSSTPRPRMLLDWNLCLNLFSLRNIVMR